MNDFRVALESLAAGTGDPAAVKDELAAHLAAEPARAAALGALIEDSFRTGAMGGQVYLDLMAQVRAVAPAAAADAAEGRTRLRPAARPAAEAGETRFRPQQRATADDSSTPRSGPTGSSWGNPATWADARALQPGDVVKERFVLEEIIGHGGMGVVFRARDMRKEEAQDRNPHVALKVLNEDFKQHPESLKALQREARKAQNLAHPNIVTVYDFDRDGSNVYIVMELLDGQPLDQYIRSLDGRGLPLGKALPIIRALCSALSHAHQHHVVHSDFKPANAFITRGGAIKVFDFGIARAARIPVDATAASAGDAASPLTMFDAGTLGALTPAYASCEMLDGLDPDPRDDVYALGCVAYELLGGAHPFQRKSAAQAREAKLSPRPIRGLTGRQWRALRRALSFERATRSASADAFLQGLSPQRRSAALWVGAAAMLLITVAAGLWLPGYLQSRRAAALAARMTSGVPQDMAGALPEFMALPDTVRSSLLLDEKLRTALIAHSRAQIGAAFDVAQQRYDYPRAARDLQQLAQLLPDSQAVAQLGADLEQAKNDEIKRQSDRLDECLKQGWLVEEQNPVNARGVLAIVAQIDPAHPLLGDARLPGVYAEQAQLALRRSSIGLAQALATAGLSVAPRDATLQDLNDRIGRESAARAQAARLAEVRRRLGDDLPGIESLAQLEAVHEDLALLRAAEPRDPGLLRVQARVQQLLDRDIAALVQAGSLDQAQALLARHADLAQPDYVSRQRAALAGSYASRGVSTASRDAAVAGLRQALDALLGSPASEDNWDGRVRKQLVLLSAYLPSNDAYVSEAVRRAAVVHMQSATTLLEQGRLSEAERTLQLVQGYSADLPQLGAARERLATLRAEQNARDLEQKRVAEINARKQKFQDQASANDVGAAAESLRLLRASLPPDDPVLQSAPKSLAEAYARLGEAAVREGRPDAADRLFGSALELDAGNARATAARAELARQLVATRGGASGAQTAAPPVLPATPPPATPPAATSPAVATPVAPVVAQSGDAASVTKVVAPGAAPAPSSPQATASSGACSASLAGYGSRSRGICYDTLPGGRGPDLVVVPAGDGVAAPFAISRYEIAGSDYALFCQQSGRCTFTGQAGMPVTGIAVTEAQQYAQWLFNSTGFTYRLPTEAEWMHAAKAPGGSTDRSYNCVVEIGGQKIRGFGLVAVREGQANGWGLLNLFGNAREWVKTAQGWSTRGGAYSDPISQCDADTGRASAGTADAATGFRLVRELR